MFFSTFRFLKIFVFFFFSALFPMMVFSAAMQSASYKIESDSLNAGGTENSLSSNYQVSDTVGEAGTGNLSSASYNLFAGYRQMTEVYLAISSPTDISMSPSINGLTGGTSNGSAVWTVTTNSPGGYTLALKASSSPALRLPSGADFFADYTPAGADPDFSFSVLASASEFGFTPEGSDIVQKYKDNGSLCNTGSSDTADSCWNALSTSAETVSQSTSGNSPSGMATTIKFRSFIGASHSQTAGTYTATTTVTAIAL